MRIKLDKPVQMVRLSDELLAAVGPGHSISRIDGGMVVVLTEGQDEKLAQQVIDAHDGSVTLADRVTPTEAKGLLGHLDQFDEKEQGEIRALAAKADTDLIEKAKGR